MNPDTPHILVTDDDDGLRALLSRFLTEEGFLVTVARDAKEARALLKLYAFDLMVLDVMMPGETGTELARSLTDSPPILMLTAMGDTDHRITGLEAGADDYLAKPFEPRELILRIRSILKRTKQQVASGKEIHFGEFIFDLASGKLTQQGDPVYLTNSETELLKLLAERVGTSVSREELTKLAGLATASGGNDRAVDVQINRLRKKIEAVPGRPFYIQTVRNAGYMLQL